jgi:hypothetical protein
VDVALEAELIRAVYANLGVLGDPEAVGPPDRDREHDRNQRDRYRRQTGLNLLRHPGAVLPGHPRDGDPAYDPAELLSLLDENDIYSIARWLSSRIPSSRKAGRIWRFATK